jgi:ferritin
MSNPKQELIIASNNTLQWFVTEQVEEENTVEEIFHKLEMIGDNKGGLYTCQGSAKAETDTG